MSLPKRRRIDTSNDPNVWQKWFNELSSEESDAEDKSEDEIDDLFYWVFHNRSLIYPHQFQILLDVVHFATEIGIDRLEKSAKIATDMHVKIIFSKYAQNVRNNFCRFCLNFFSRNIFLLLCFVLE